MAKGKNVKSDPLPPGNGGGECQDTLKCFTDYKEGAEARKTESEGVSDALGTTFKGKLDDVCDERRNFKKANDTLNIYNDIYYCQSISLCKDIEQSQETVKLKTELAGKVKANFETVGAKLKTIKTKLTNVKNLTGTLETAVCDSCNTESKKAIAKKVGEQELLGCVAKIKELSLVAEGVSDQASESSVIVAGVLAFTNVASIKPYTDSLKEKCDTFKKDVEENVKNTSKTIDGVKKSLNDALCELSVAEVAWRRIKTVTAGIGQSIAHLDTRTDSPPTTPFEDIPKAVKQVISGTPKPIPGTSDDDDV